MTVPDPGREPRPDRGPGVVVVGVDGSAGSLAALDHALGDAARRRAGLRLVVAVDPPQPWAPTYRPTLLPVPDDLLDAAVRVGRGWARDAAARRRLATGSGPVDEPGDEPAVEVRAVSGPAAAALLDAARDADLLVVGHRGRGAAASVLLGSVGLLGSVALRCLLEACCPVTVVPPVPVPRPVTEPVPLTVTPVPAG
ncbi:universal stress protein [Pseudonocardia hydrocarbonoxydans]|uniref:universal stress protein n=1 Tax=Pseudonocardia hydrocarbonoxydans TaxID=76726 RepID=UPI0031DF37CF